MSKKTKQPSYPSYSGGAVTINGRNLASVNKANNKVYSDYNMTNAEKTMYDSLQNNMAASMKNLFSISDTERKQWQNQLDAMKQQGTQIINDIYKPMETNLKNDISSRFGNLDNSIFMNGLNNITNKKAYAVSNLANNLALKQSDLYTQEIQNRMNLLNMMNNINSSLNNQIMQYMNIASGNSTNGMQYNQNAYNAAYNAAANQNNGTNWVNTLLNTGLSTLGLFM